MLSELNTLRHYGQRPKAGELTSWYSSRMTALHREYEGASGERLNEYVQRSAELSSQYSDEMRFLRSSTPLPLMSVQILDDDREAKKGDRRLMRSLMLINCGVFVALLLLLAQQLAP